MSDRIMLGARSAVGSASCDESSCEPSRAPVACFVVLIATGLLLVVLAVRLGRRARRSGGRRGLVPAVVCWGLTAVTLVVVLSGLRHFGGRYHNATIGSDYRCAAWLDVMSHPGGLTNADFPSVPCRSDAVASVVPSLLEALAAGVIVGLLTFALLDRRRRRFDRVLRNLVG